MSSGLESHLTQPVGLVHVKKQGLQAARLPNCSSRNSHFTLIWGERRKHPPFLDFIFPRVPGPREPSQSHQTDAALGTPHILRTTFPWTRHGQDGQTHSPAPSNPAGPVVFSPASFNRAADAKQESPASSRMLLVGASQPPLPHLQPEEPALALTSGSCCVIASGSLTAAIPT